LGSAAQPGAAHPLDAVGPALAPRHQWRSGDAMVRPADTGPDPTAQFRPPPRRSRPDPVRRRRPARVLEGLALAVGSPALERSRRALPFGSSRRRSVTARELERSRMTPPSVASQKAAPRRRPLGATSTVASSAIARIEFAAPLASTDCLQTAPTLAP